MKIRVGTSQRIAAVLAASARAWLRARAEEALPEPQSQALLSNPKRAMQQQRPGQSVAANGVVEPRTKRRMAMNGEEGHGWKVWHRRAARKGQRRGGAGPKARRPPHTIHPSAQRDVRHKT